MELEELIPGMEHSGKAANHGLQVFVLRQFLAQRAQDGGEEQVKGLSGKGAKETAAQLGWEGKGDQEVRGVD